MGKKKCVVTGGAGFIGSHIVDMLLDEDFDVVIIDNLSSGSEKKINGRARFYQMNIQDLELVSVFEREKPEFVFHQAAQKDVRISITDPIFDAESNVLGTINILQNCVEQNVRKIVFASTGGAIYGEQDIFPAPENHPTRPISPYGVTKLTAEHYMHYYKTVFGLDYTSLRYANVYGPRQDPMGEAGVVAIFIQKLIDGQTPVINGDGEQTRDFVYVEDIARANVMAAMNDASESIFNIGTGVETTINDLLNHLTKLTGCSIKGRHAAPKTGEQRRSVIDCSKAKTLLGWEPSRMLEDGLRCTCEYFKA